jgi:hypothetical protein
MSDAERVLAELALEAEVRHVRGYALLCAIMEGGALEWPR